MHRGARTYKHRKSPVTALQQSEKSVAFIFHLPGPVAQAELAALRAHDTTGERATSTLLHLGQKFSSSAPNPISQSSPSVSDRTSLAFSSRSDLQVRQQSLCPPTRSCRGYRIEIGVHSRPLLRLVVLDKVKPFHNTPAVTLYTNHPVSRPGSFPHVHFGQLLPFAISTFHQRSSRYCWGLSRRQAGYIISETRAWSIHHHRGLWRLGSPRRRGRFAQRAAHAMAPSPPRLRILSGTSLRAQLPTLPSSPSASSSILLHLRSDTRRCLAELIGFA